MTEWVVIVYDKPNTDRSKVRPQHVAAIPAAVTAGIVTNVGAIFHTVPNPATDEKPPFAGSAFNLIAESREEILEFLKKDIYAKEGIWDLDSFIAYPYSCAARVEKKLP
ncbi:hypothetical protein BABINDRAFT_32271 [Babjeviella inositovora NRRL Y-12698]|uniref:YCII-related domain-containing protein n=1 Tax=Babjeviella inositovora NRRL Y-12698 TaxID=984486 RepID=A0A1E3QW89_9ASCO|nr:uncharacterized protein BABINDRAFT_32271 [Babjeviella inositovora NRRL Y-12698]ODQ81933.1 hypothetical protein BABINDRAFT_32271 [Babjeviella inositovora NRRL Y-12698]